MNTTRCGRRDVRLRLIMVAGAAALVLVALTRGPALAAPDVRTTLSNGAFSFVIDELMARIDRQYDLGDYHSDLYSCPLLGGDASVSLRQAGFSLDLWGMELSTRKDKLIATFTLAVDGSAKLKARDILCVTGNADCTVDFDARNVDVLVELIPTVTNGKISLARSDVIVNLDTYNFDLELKGCGTFGSLAQSIYGVFEKKVVDDLRDELEQSAREELVDAVEELLAGFTQLSGEGEGFRLTARPENLPVDETGIGVDFAVSVGATRQANCQIDGEAPEPAEAEAVPSFAFRGEHIGLAISESVLENSLVQAWRAGVFCFNDEESKSLGGAFGVRMPEPPRVSIVPGKEARFVVLLPALELDLKGLGVQARMDVRTELRLGLNLSSAVLLTDPIVTIENMKVSSDGEQLIDYASLVARVLPGLIRGPLSDAILLPRVLHSDGGILGDYFVSIARAVATEQHILLYALLTKRPENDDVPPNTELVEAPDGWAAASTLFVAMGSDDQTPAALLRYRWRVDGGSWSEPTLSGRHTVEFEGGRHTVEVAAVDLNDNADESPAAVTFDVDAEAPTIEITQAPPDSLRDTRFVIRFEVADDRTPDQDIKVHVLYERQAGAAGASGADEVTQMEDVVMGLSKLKLFAMGPGLHTLSLVAEDRAGNRSAPAFALFEAVDAQPTVTDDLVAEPPPAGGGCCSISRRPAASMSRSLLALGLMALYLSTRRRRGRRPAVRASEKRAS